MLVFQPDKHMQELLTILTLTITKYNLDIKLNRDSRLASMSNDPFNNIADPFACIYML